MNEDNYPNMDTDPAFSAATPLGWSRRVMQIYSAPPPTPSSGIAPNVVLMRETLPAGAPPAERSDQLMAYAQSQVRSLGAQLREPAFDPLERLIYRDVPVVRVNVTWSSGKTRVRQWIVFFPLADTHVLVATATAADSEFRTYTPAFAELLGSVTLPS